MREQALEDLTASFYLKRNNIVRQAIQADPLLIEKAAERVEMHHPRKRLQEYETATEAHQASPMVKVAIEEVIADEFCKDRLAPIVAAYEDEKARILGDGSP